MISLAAPHLKPLIGSDYGYQDGCSSPLTAETTLSSLPATHPLFLLASPLAALPSNTPTCPA